MKFQSCSCSAPFEAAASSLVKRGCFSSPVSSPRITAVSRFWFTARSLASFPHAVNDPADANWQNRVQHNIGKILADPSSTPGLYEAAAEMYQLLPVE
jgi:hypothetical protein